MENVVDGVDVGRLVQRIGGVGVTVGLRRRGRGLKGFNCAALWGVRLSGGSCVSGQGGGRGKDGVVCCGG